MEPILTSGSGRSPEMSNGEILRPAVPNNVEKFDTNYFKLYYHFTVWIQ